MDKSAVKVDGLTQSFSRQELRGQGIFANTARVNEAAPRPAHGGPHRTAYGRLALRIVGKLSAETGREARPRLLK